MKWFIKCIKQYADFKGRARRKEYWMFALFCSIIMIIATFLLCGISIVLESEAGVFAVLLVLLGLFFIIPGIAVTVRRLHDIGKSGVWYLINFIPYIGGIWLLILTCLDSEPGTNEWGDNPKEIND